MDDRFMLKLAQENIEADYASGKITHAQYLKEMTYSWNYRRQLQAITTEAGSQASCEGNGFEPAGALQPES